MKTTLLFVLLSAIRVFTVFKPLSSTYKPVRHFLKSLFAIHKSVRTPVYVIAVC